MDTAILLSPSLINRPGAPKLVKNATVYLGDEFCIHKQPSFADFAAVRKLTGKAPVLVGTLLTESAFESWAGLLSECVRKAPGAEIVVNDLGLLHFINKNYRGRFRITLGRLMTYFFDPKERRVPGSKTDSGWMEGGKLKSWEARRNDTPIGYIKNFLKRYAVERVETDNEYIFRKYADNTDVKISFHYPLRLMAVTRFCPFRGGIAPGCKAPCGSRLLKLETPYMDYCVFSKGNAYFVKNRLIKHPRVDRKVITSFVRSPGFRQILNKYAYPDGPGTGAREKG